MTGAELSAGCRAGCNSHVVPLREPSAGAINRPQASLSRALSADGQPPTHRVPAHRLTGAHSAAKLPDRRDFGISAQNGLEADFQGRGADADGDHDVRALPRALPGQPRAPAHRAAAQLHADARPGRARAGPHAQHRPHGQRVPAPAQDAAAAQAQGADEQHPAPLQQGQGVRRRQGAAGHPDVRAGGQAHPPPRRRPGALRGRDPGQGAEQLAQPAAAAAAAGGGGVRGQEGPQEAQGQGAQEARGQRLVRGGGQRRFQGLAQEAQEGQRRLGARLGLVERRRALVQRAERRRARRHRRRARRRGRRGRHAAQPGRHRAPLRRARHARRPQRAHLLPLPPGVLRGDDRLRQPRLPHRVVPLRVRRPRHQAQGQVVLPQVQRGSQEEVRRDRAATRDSSLGCCLPAHNPPVVCSARHTTPPVSL